MGGEHLTVIVGMGNLTIFLKCPRIAKRGFLRESNTRFPLQMKDSHVLSCLYIRAQLLKGELAN